MSSVSGDLVSGGLALTAAVLFPVGSAMQQRANLVQMRVARSASATEAARGVVRQPLWWGGQVVAASGSGFQIAAVAMGALSLVSPVLLTQLAWMVPAGAWVVGGRMRGRDWGGAVLTMVGLTALVIALQPTEARDAGPPMAWIAALGVFGSAFGLSWFFAPRSGDYRAALLGFAAGIETGIMGAVLKQAVSDISVTNWTVWAAPVLGLAAVPLINLALRAGRLASAQTMMAVVSSVVGFAIGPWVYGEKLTLDPSSIATVVVSLGVVIAGLGLLARSPSLLALDRAARAAREAESSLS